MVVSEKGGLDEMLSGPSGSQHQSRVLVVEDEGIIARDIQNILERLGYEVTGQAGSGAEALKLAALVKADIVLMDIKIRGSMDGVETAEQIRRRHRIPVVFLTAYADSDTVRRANRTEPFGYIVKPFSEADIKVAIEVALNRHRLQSEVEQKEAWFSTALDSIRDAIITTSYDGRIDFLNAGAERLTGWTSANARGQYFQDVVRLLADENDPSFDELRFGMAPEHASVFAQVRLRALDGTEHSVVGSVGPMRRPGSGESVGSVMILREATLGNSAGRQSQPDRSTVTQSNQRLTELSYALAHDLREPVRNMSTFAQLLVKEQPSDADASRKEYLQFIVEGSKRMDALLVGLYRYHAAGEAERVLSAISDANAVLRQVLAALAPAIEAASAHVHSDSLPAVAIDAAALGEVFEILIGNAIRFRSDRPLVIEIASERVDDFWKIVVADNGLGIEPDHLERIFTLFKKAHSQQVAGSGIGLAVCRRLVELYGGKIWAESEAGEGSRFCFTVPVPVR